MGSLSMVLGSFPPILSQNHPKPLKPSSFKPYLSLFKTTLSPLPKTSLTLTTLNFLISLPSLASETLTSQTEQVSDKISLESILVSIDDFFNRNPFFVAGCTFIWLVVIPLTQEYLSKYKFVSAIDAFRKLRDDPAAQLLDIRDKRSLVALGSPDLKILDKSVVQIEFNEDDEDGFVRNVLDSFRDPANTILCILDNFDGNSKRAAELLFKDGGFKEAYAIRGGVRGKKGWLAIQSTLLPPPVHISPKKKKKKAKLSQAEVNGGVAQKNRDKNDTSSVVEEIQGVDNGHVNKSTNSTPHIKISSRSPYPNYPDLKPPSSPSPSKPWR